MTTSFRAFVSEPFDLALGHPHQVLISSASVAIVAAEAATLIPFPFNIFLAVGAEWAYLRGLISGAGVKTRWAAGLNISAVLLVVLYGALWGFRSFHLIPDAPPTWAAITLTIIHIGAIGMVTFCSAMLHRAGEAAKAAEQKIAQNRETERQQRLDDARADLAVEMERKRQELLIWEEGMAAKARLKMQSTNARMKMRRDAQPEPMDATCPKCGAQLDKPQWLAARRWGHCAACKAKAS